MCDWQHLLVSVRVSVAREYEATDGHRHKEGHMFTWEGVPAANLVDCTCMQSQSQQQWQQQHEREAKRRGGEKVVEARSN